MNIKSIFGDELRPTHEWVRLINGDHTQLGETWEDAWDNCKWPLIIDFIDTGSKFLSRPMVEFKDKLNDLFEGEWGEYTFGERGIIEGRVREDGKIDIAFYDGYLLVNDVEIGPTVNDFATHCKKHGIPLKLKDFEV